jgi:site-specific DNA recombinase
VSDPKQKEGMSLQSQEAACRQYAAEHGYTVDDEHVFTEVHTGVELWERPALTRLREAIRHSEIDIVIVYAIDRLSRDPVHLGVILTEADHHKVEVEFVTEPLDDSPEGQLIRFVRGYAAKIEHEKIRERTIRGKRTRVQAGKIHRHGIELYGYRRDKAAGVRIIHEIEAAVVRQIFTWFVVERLALRRIAQLLNEAGTPPPSTGKIRPSSRITGPYWGKTQIVRILTQPSYKGEPVAWRWASGGKRRPDAEAIPLPPETTPAIVAPATWDSAPTLLGTNHGEATRNLARPILLRGMVTCAVCGRKMRPDFSQRWPSYRCSSRETATGRCTGKPASAKALEAWAWEKIDSVLRNPETITTEVERQRAKGAESGLHIDRDAAARALAKIERDQQRLIRRYREAEDDTFPWKLVEREIATAEQEKKQLQATIDRFDRLIAEQEAAIVQLDALTAYCERVATRLETANFADKRGFLEALGVEVIANGRQWRIQGSFPFESNAGVLATTS